MNLTITQQGNIVDEVKAVAKKANLTSYDVEFENKGGIDFVVLKLEGGVTVPQELCTGWPAKLHGSLEALKSSQRDIKQETEQALSIAVLHRPSGRWTATEVLRKDIVSYAQAIIAAFKKTGPADDKDFSVIEVDWSKKNVNITQLEV